jgi:hypothetical protein
MKNGKCTQCGGTDIRIVPFLGGHRDFRPVKQFSKGLKLNEHICCSCGLVVTYLANLSDVEQIREKCNKVETHE